MAKVVLAFSSVLCTSELYNLILRIKLIFEDHQGGLRCKKKAQELDFRVLREPRYPCQTAKMPLHKALYKGKACIN